MARFVVKFGGSVLSDEKGVENAALYIKRLCERGDEVAVVVSALKGVTDDLLRSAQRLNPDAPPSLLDELLAMGERTSARLFALALKKHGIEAVVIDPSSESWPIITDEKHLDANPILEECRLRAGQGIARLLEQGAVPIVCGYVGLSRSGKITTMGRGGSDTTAVLLANCLNADEVVLVKDVGGVYTTDPKNIPGADVLDVLSTEEVLRLSKGGAKIIHSKALMYMHPKGRIRIGSLDMLETGGTLILGEGISKLDVNVDNTNVTMVTVIGPSMDEPSKMATLVSALQATKARVIATSVEKESIILYLDGNGEYVEKIHEYFVGHRLGKAVSHFPHLSLIRIYGSMLETVPGVIHKVLQPLAAQAINVYGVLTISSSIRVFVSTKDVEKAVKLIKENLEDYLHLKS